MGIQRSSVVPLSQMAGNSMLWRHHATPDIMQSSGFFYSDKIFFIRLRIFFYLYIIVPLRPSRQLHLRASNGDATIAKSLVYLFVKPLSKSTILCSK